MSRALGVAVMVAVLAACGTAPSATPASAEPASGPLLRSPAGSPGTEPSSHAGSGAPASATASGQSTVRVDPSLLDLVPGDVDGVRLTFAPDAAAEAARDPQLARTAESVAYAVAAGDGGGDLAIVSVVRLRDGVFDDGVFRDWRDSYNDEVCAPGGGVTGNAEAEIGGRPVHVATCAGGGHTYHAWLESERSIVSVYGAGERRLGELAIAGITAP